MSIKINRKNLAITQVTAVVLALIIIVAAVGSVIGYMYYIGAFSSAKPELRIFIASSLTYVVANMTAEFEQENNCKLVVNSAGSNMLYTQITSGSPCDVFMTADFKWTNQLNASGLLYNNVYKNFTTNSIVVLLPAGSTITSLSDLINSGVKIVVADNSVPAGSYTNKTVTKITATWGNASSSSYVTNGSYVDYYNKFYANVVSFENSVESVVGKVALGLGTCDAGVAFISDAKYGQMTGKNYQSLAIPSAVNTKGTYSIAVLGSTSNIALAQKFMDYWSSTAGQALLTAYGFNS